MKFLKCSTWLLLLAVSQFLWAQSPEPNPQIPNNSKNPKVSLTTEVSQGGGVRVILADSFGKTLYVFDPDQQSKGSVCDGSCAEIWPPYIVSAEEAAQLVEPLSTVVRSSGELQLTYQGRPLYTYIFDRKVADDLGDGIFGVWHIVVTFQVP